MKKSSAFHEPWPFSHHRPDSIMTRVVQNNWLRIIDLFEPSLGHRLQTQARQVVTHKPRNPEPRRFWLIFNWGLRFSFSLSHAWRGRWKLKVRHTQAAVSRQTHTHTTLWPILTYSEGVDEIWSFILSTSHTNTYNKHQTQIVKILHIFVWCDVNVCIFGQTV